MSDVRVIGVYNANGGIVGELRYLAGKLSGTSHCALCEITHGLNPWGKKDWKQAATCITVPVEFVHLNDMNPRTATVMATTSAPAVVVLHPAGDRVLVSSEEIESCGAHAEGFAELINRKMSSILP